MRRPLAPQALETLAAAAVPCWCGVSEPGPWHPEDLGSNPSSVSHPEPRLSRVSTGQIGVNGVKGLTPSRCPRSRRFLIFSHWCVAQKGFIPCSGHSSQSGPGSVCPSPPKSEAKPLVEFASPYLHQHRPLSPRGDSHPGGFQRLQVPAGWEEGEAAPAHVLVAGAGDGEAATGGWPEEPAEGCSDGRRAVRVGARQRDREMPATLLTQQLWKHACPTSTRNKSRLTLENQRRQHSSGIRVKSENARRRRSCRDERRPLVSFLIQDEPVTFSEKPFGNMCR